jgi:serine/threonine protein kinase
MMSAQRGDEPLEISLTDRYVLRIPIHFSHYTYVKTLGEGCSSAVILVRDRYSSNLYACKVVSRRYLVEQDMFGPFEQEVRLLPTLQQSNIIRFVDIVFETEVIFVIMEYCSQGDLFRHIVARGVLQEGRACEIFRGIADAVRFIHERGIVHRDLKPENILLDHNFTPKIADFGLCHIAAPNSFLSTPCGSPLYAAPEVIAGGPYDGRKADVWSLGVLLFTMVTGLLPWSSRNQVELFRQIREEVIEIPTTVSPALQELLRRMLERNTVARPSIAEVCNDPWFEKNAYVRSLSYVIRIDQDITDEEHNGKAVRVRQVLVRPRRNAGMRSIASLRPSALPGVRGCRSMVRG